jgi:predicted ATP-grasp superfamily ATP-dependent carboligase
MPRLPLAIVLGDSNLLKPLAREGIPCALAIPPRAPLRYSRHARHVLTWRDDGPLERQGARLLEFAAGQPVPPVILFQSDAQLLWVSRNRDQLRGVARFAIADRELVEQLVDKTAFVALADHHRLPVPPSVTLSATDDYAPPRDAPMPAVVKPATRTIDEEWQRLAGDRKVLSVSTPSDLDSLRPHLLAYGKPVLLQRDVPGGESRIESYHVYVDAAGTVVAEFTGKKIRTLPLEKGITTSVEVLPIPDVRLVGRDVIERIGLTGVAKLDFKRAADGALFLLEVNPRFSLWNNPGAAAGFNIPAAVYADLVGLPRPEFRQGSYRVRWFNVNDLAAARASGVSLGGWLAWLARERPTSGLALDDPMPTVELLWQLMRRR